MLLRSDAFTSLDYIEVKLPFLELELSENSSLVISVDYGKSFLPLGEVAFEQLLGYLGAPVGFARKLRKAGRGHILSYLHKQLASSIGQTPYIAVIHPTEGLVGLSEQQTIFFKKEEAVELDRRLENWLSVSNCSFTLKNYYLNNGAVRYLLLSKDEYLVPDVKQSSNWRWGFELRHSLWGTEKASFYVALERKEDQSLTYLPELKYHYPLNFDANVANRLESIFVFLNAAPEPHWKELTRLVQRLGQQQASLAEVKKVRKKLISFFKGQECEGETKTRVDSWLDWKYIVDTYGLKEMDEKPSLKWFQRASTPVNLFELYNFLAKEVTYAPNTVDLQVKESLLALAGDFLCKKPDLEDLPPRINWGYTKQNSLATYGHVQEQDSKTKVPYV